MATRIIGIDFGTSTTVVRVHNVGGGNRIVSLAINGQRTIPTIAFQGEESSEMYYGYDAQAKYDSNTKGTPFKNFKMDIIADNEVKRGQAEKLIQGFLRYVYEQYLSLLNAGGFDPADEVKVYVSHPAKWNSYARTLMKQSVAKAGFCKEENISLKDEPTAAILAVIHEKNVELKQAGMLHENRTYKAMMVDMGAGTTDIVLCTYKVSNGRLEIDDIFTYPSINTPGLCGGREIDDAIVSEAEKFVNNMQQKPSPRGQMYIERFRHNVRIWKDKTLSPALGNRGPIPEPDQISGFRDELLNYGMLVVNDNKRFSFTRKEFELLTKDHWVQWAKLLAGAFDEVEEEQYKNLECPKRPEDVELLIITGGHSKWYIVAEYLLGKKGYVDMNTINFAKIHNEPFRLVQSADPQETVAVGLCHMDEDVVGTIAMANDVSMSFTCEGKYLGACDLIKKGVPLPFEKRDFLIENSIKGNFIFRRKLNIEYSIITDKCNTITKSIIVPSDAILFSLIKIVLSAVRYVTYDMWRIWWYFLRGKLDELDGTIIDIIIDYDYSAELSPDINVNEEGIIKVGGTIKVDGKELTIPEIVI